MKIRPLVAALCCGFIAASCGGAGGNGSPQIPPVVPPANVPNAPAGVSATVGSGTVTLSWQGVSSAQSYSIYYRDTPGVTKQNGIRLGNVQPPETISGLVNGTPYYFVVTGVNAAGEGNPSSELEATPELQRPGRVQALHATPGDAEATIEWSESVDATSYDLRWWTDNPFSNQKTRIANVISPFVMSGIENSVTYYFDVVAVNSVGEAQESPYAHATPIDPATGWSIPHRITPLYMSQQGGVPLPSEVRISVKDISSNDDGLVAVAAEVCGGTCTTPSVVLFHNAEGDWTGPVNVDTDVKTQRPSVIVTPAGQIVAAYERDGNSIYARSYRNGVWEDPIRIDSRGFQYHRAFVDVAYDAAGNMVAAWMEARDLDPNELHSQVQQVWTNKYDAATDSWGSPTMLIESIRSVSQISVGLSENDQAIVVWLQDTLAYDPDVLGGGPRQSLVYGSRFDGSEWSVASPLGSSPFIGVQIALDVNATGSALVTSYLQHYDENGVGFGRVEANRFDAATEQWDPPLHLGDSWQSFSMPVAHIDDSGHAIAAWSSDGLVGAEYDPLTATWGATGPIIANGAGGESHIDADDGGRSVAFWTTQDQVDGIYTSSSQDGRITWTTPVLLGPVDGGYASSVAPGGKVYVSMGHDTSIHDGTEWVAGVALFLSTYTPPP